MPGARSYLIDPATNQSVVLDLVDSFSRSFAADVSTNTLEDGTQIADHVKSRPTTYDYSGRLSDDFPLDSDASKKTVIKRIDQIDAWRKSATPVDVLNAEPELKKVVIVKFNPKLTKDGYTFGLAVERIRIAKTIIRQIKIPRPARKKRQKGNTPKTKKTQRRSLLKKASGLLP